MKWQNRWQILSVEPWVNSLLKAKPMAVPSIPLLQNSLIHLFGQSWLSFASAIWSTRKLSCIGAIQSRAWRFFMGVGKYTPNDAIDGDMSWTPPWVKLWVPVFRQWKWFTVMDRDMIVNFKVFNWSLNFKIEKKLVLQS